MGEAEMQEVDLGARETSLNLPDIDDILLCHANVLPTHE